MHFLTYIWIDGEGKLRSKVKLEQNMVDYPVWNYDGSSCYQADTASSEVILMPVVGKEDFIKSDCMDRELVLCEAYIKKSDGSLKPALKNHRSESADIFDEHDHLEPWFGFELEFFVFDKKTGYPVGYTPDVKQGPFYCSVGQYSKLREFIEKVVERCVKLDLNITGYNFEVAPGQAEIQVIGVGIDASDQFMFMKYVLEYTSEEFDYSINYEPKPFEHLNGSGCHINFSTRERKRGIQ